MSELETLLTISEAIFWSRINPKFPTCDVNDIAEAERFEFFKCLGDDFYDELKDDVIEYDDPEWSSGAYNEDDIVSYDGLWYKAQKDTSESPKVSSDWKLAPKFSEEKYETLWCNYLARYLSLVVINDSIPTSVVEMGSSGITRKHGENFMPADSREVARFAKAFDTKISKTYKLMDAYLKDNKKDFPLYLPNVEDDCKDNKCNKRKNDWIVG